MALTRAQRKYFKEAERIAELAKVDYYNVEEVDPEFRIVHLKIAINRIVIAQIVTSYTLLDEILADIIARYYFKYPGKARHWRNLWRTKKFRVFVHHISDEMYLLKKMEIVHAIKPIPSDASNIVRKINALRNAFAHSFFPENRKEYRKHKKVRYGDKDIRTAEGLELFLDDFYTAMDYFGKRAYGKWM